MSVVALPKAAEKLQNLGHLQDIPAVRQLGVLLAAAGAIALGLWLFFWSQSPTLVPVLPGADHQTVAEASELLAASSIDFELAPGGSLSVPQDQLAKARLALASAGLPGKAEGGFEMLQGDQGFGTSQFVENARYQHALETELARTIGNLQPVREARVHLGIPKPSAFTRQRQPARASVVLKLRTGARLEPSQAAAIVHLVSSSIPDLPPESVTVVDQSGRLLSGSESGGEEEQGARQLAQQRKQESVYVDRIQALLEPMTGPGRVSAQVSVDMDFSQREEAREIFGEPGSVRSEQVSEVTSGTTAAAAQGVPGANANTPDPVGTTAGEPGTTTGPGSRSQVRNYELDRTLTHTRQGPGRITRVNAAVLIDHIPAPGEDGAPSTRALTEEEIARIQTLVREAVGFDAERGDSVSVVNAQFVAHELGPVEELPFWQKPGFSDVLRLLVGGLAVLLVIWTVVRPTFRQLVAPKRTGTTVATVVDDELPPLQPVPPVPGEQAPLLDQPSGDDRARRVANLEDKLQVARGAVKSDPKRVAGLVRNMMAKTHG